MSRKNSLKEKVVDAARRIADSLPTTANYAARGQIVLAAGLGGIASDLAANASGLYLVGGLVGGTLLGVGALLRFLPGTSADLRQTAMKMVEGGIILLAIVGTGALILGGAHWIGERIASNFGASPGTRPEEYINPWSK
jgi:hypothetical protein